jgi:fermentation-respiration switch protein FrsA (DUF1100 family)
MTDTAAAPDPAPRKPKTLTRRILRGVASLAFIYTGVSVGIGCNQRRMMFPGMKEQGAAWTIVKDDDHRTMSTLTAKSGDKLAFAFIRTRNGDPTTAPTALYFYGNAECIAAAIPTAMRFESLGCNIAIVDYPGFGMSTGTTTEQGIYEAATLAYEKLLQQSDLDHDKIFVAGTSLGASIAIDLASRKPVAGVVTMSAFTSMVDMARVLYPILPAKLIVQHRFLSIDKVSQIKAPMLIMHGTADPFVPKWMSEKLAEKAGGTVTTHWIVDGDHNEVWDAGGAPMRAAMEKFVEELKAR